MMSSSDESISEATPNSSETANSSPGQELKADEGNEKTLTSNFPTKDEQQKNNELNQMEPKENYNDFCDGYLSRHIQFVEFEVHLQYLHLKLLILHFYH